MESFFLGLEKLHQITSAREHELLVELKYAIGNSVYAWYSSFEIGTEVEQYSLKKLGHYTGTADDLMSSHVGKKFTTKDRNNGATRDGDCEVGWWMDPCTSTNINRPRNKRFAFVVDRLSKLLLFTRMMIREV